MTAAPNTAGSNKVSLSSSFETPMRQVINPQLQLGEQDIGAIVLDPKSRDDIPQILRITVTVY